MVGAVNDQPDQQPGPQTEQYEQTGESSEPTPVIDTDLIQRYEDELADVARTLESVERIVQSGDDPAVTVRQLDELTADGRFAVDPTPGE